MQRLVSTSLRRCTALPQSRVTPRMFASDRSKSKDDDLLSAENIKDLSPLEVARLRVIHGLLKEHVHALESKSEMDGRNPLIDPRSFTISKLPTLPPSLLKHFREQLPAEVAGESRPVSTKNVWDSLNAGADLGAEFRGDGAEEWSVVDERTMDARQYARMRRQSLTDRGDVGYRADMPSTRKKVCPLKDERGRVDVDFRMVGVLGGFLTDNKKILPRRRSGLSAKAQRKVSRAVKTARCMALLDPEPKPRITVEELRALEASLN